MNIIIEFENGSSGVVAYYANGSKALRKEYFEAYSAGMTATIDDFVETKIYGKGKPSKFKTRAQDKGQKAMIESFFNEVKNGKTPIPMEEIFADTLATFAALKSVQESGAPVVLNI